MRPILADTVDEALEGSWFWTRNFDCEREEIMNHLGPAHWTLSEGGLLYDFHYWFLRAECGFRICYKFSAAGPKDGWVCTSVPEDEHLLRHDPWLRDHSHIRDDLEFEMELRMMIEHYSLSIPELKQPRIFQVWRMGDDGNEMPVGFPTSEHDAKCHVAELESHNHKQIYWYKSTH